MILSDQNVKTTEEDAYNNFSVGKRWGCSCPAIFPNEDQHLVCTIDLILPAQCPRSPMKSDSSADCERGELFSTPQVASENFQILPETIGASSSHASIMQSDENVRECQEVSCKVAFRDLEAGLSIDNSFSVDEEEKHAKDICKDGKISEVVEGTHRCATVEGCDHTAASCDMKAVVDSELRKALLAHVQTDDTKSSQDKEVILSGENKSGGDLLEREAEVNGLRKRRGAKVDTLRASTTGESGIGKMPEEEKRVAVTAARMKDGSNDSGHEVKQKPVEKKAGKQGKGVLKPAGRRVVEPQPLEELQSKDEAENRKVQESIDNLIRQTIRCEPYITFPGRPGEKPLQRLRPDVFENHVAGKFARGFKVDGGSDARDVGSEECSAGDSHPSDFDGLKDNINNSAKGVGGLGRGSQHSLKVPPGVVAFTQAAAKGTDLPGWPLLSPSKVVMTKCEKCIREFCSTLNYRRHVRLHRKPLNPEKKDLSKERSKVAEFWDKLTPEQASDIVHFENMEIEDLSGESLLKALASHIQQPGIPSMPQGILKAGALLLDIVQNKVPVFPLSSERLLSILDDASEKTFLSGGISVAYQRFVFNGDAAKVGLEEKNLVASMGFHVELRLVKAWMADKEAEALRNQQALFKEEEAAQQKRAKLLEKKRMKKIRQKERKVSASQSVLQELENESLDDEGNIQGVEEDDSPTATASSASSLVSAQDLPLPETSDVDFTDDVGQVDAKVEHVSDFEGLSASDKSKPVKEDNLQHTQDLPLSSGRRKARTQSQLDFNDAFVSVNRKDDYHAKEFMMEERGQTWSARNADEVAQGIDRDGRVGQQFTYNSYNNRNGRMDVQSGMHRGSDQDKAGVDSNKHDAERIVSERKTTRISRDRPRNEFSESFQKSGRDPRGYDARYVDSPSQVSFKPVRKVNPYSLKGDLGTSEMANFSRVQQYRSKPTGMHRTLPMIGNGQVVWTRKVPQPALVDSFKNMKEGILDEAATKMSLTVDGWETKEPLLGVPASLPDSTVECTAEPGFKEVMEKTEDATCQVSLESSAANLQDVSMGRLGDGANVAEEVVGDEEVMFSGALLVGSLSVPLGKFAMDNVFHARSYPMFTFPTKQTEVPNLLTVCDDDTCPQRLGSEFGSQEVNSPSSITVSLGPAEAFNGLGANTTSQLRDSMGTSSSASNQSPKMKLHSPTSGPERVDTGGRGSALPLGHDRLAQKQGSWQTSTGRYVSAKVWRAVGTVSDRQDVVAGLAVSGGDSEGRVLQEEMDTGNSAMVDDGNRAIAGGRDPHSDADETLGKRQRHDDGESGKFSPNTDEYSNDQSCPCRGPSNLVNSAGPEADVHPDRVSEGHGRHLNDEGAEAGLLESSLCSLSVFLEIAERFLNERWRYAVNNASVDEILVVAAEGATKVTDGCNFFEMLLQQLSGQGTRHHSGAELSPSSPPGVAQSLGKTSHDGGVFLSRIFNDSDHTGMENVKYETTLDDQRLDGVGSQENGMPQGISSEEDAGTRDSSSSPVGCDHYLSGSDTSKSCTASASPVGRVHGSEKQSESRGGGGIVGYSHGRLGNSRQERWYRNPRDRFPEQRYMPRGRAPVEKNC